MAEICDETSAAILGLAAILACLPQTLWLDRSEVERALRRGESAPQSSGHAAGSLRFVDVVGSLAMWVNALAPEERVA